MDMHDKIRQIIIQKFVLRAKIGRNMTGIIIPPVTNDLNEKSNTIKDHEVLICGAGSLGAVGAIATGQSSDLHHLAGICSPNLS